MKTIKYIYNNMKYHTRWLEEFVSEFFYILNIGDIVEYQVYLLALSESDEELRIGNYRRIDDCLKKDLEDWIECGEPGHFRRKTYIFSNKFTYENERIEGDFVVALKYDDTMFDEFIQTYLSYLIDHLLCMIEQSKTSVREAHDEAANLTNLIYLWSRKFVQDRIYSNTINMSMVSYFLDLTAVEAIADMKYESEDVSGRFIAVSSYPNKCEIKLKDTGTQVRLNEMKKVRKLLEITYQSGNDGLYLLYNRNYIEGFISPGNIKGDYYLIEFLGAGRWRFSSVSGNHHSQRIEFDGSGCRIIYPYERYSKKFERCFTSIFGSNDSLNKLCEILKNARDQKHGTMLVFLEDAKEESKRLQHAGFSVEIEKNTEKYITQIAAIDGAILLNEHGKIYAIGTILDGKMPEETGFDMARGARYNSAIKYSYSHRNKKNLCVVISEDGYVNFISNGKEIKLL